MEIKFLSEKDDVWKAKWSQFLLRSEHQHPRQDLAFSPVDVAFGRQPIYVVGHEGGEVRAISMFGLQNFGHSTTSYSEASAFNGPVCDNVDDFREFLKKIVQEPFFRKVGKVKITPYWTGSDVEVLEGMLNELGWKTSSAKNSLSTGLVDVTKNENEMFASFSKSARREIRRAQRQGVNIKSIRDENGALEFLKSQNALCAQRGMQLVGKAAFMTSFHEIYKSGDVGVILGAYKEDVFLSGLQMYRGVHVAHGRHFSSNMDALRKLSNLRISPTVWLSGAKWAAQKGCRFLDVEGYREDLPVGHEMANIFKYKGELNPTLTPRISEHYLVTNRSVDLPSSAMVLARKVLIN